jgi:hypothetical protein
MPRGEHNIEKKSTYAYRCPIETIEKGNVALVESINKIVQIEEEKSSSIGNYVT